MPNLNNILHQVKKPARYTGGEWNSIVKDWDKTPIKIALIYPDLYEIGMSNMALPILYELLNSQASDYLGNGSGNGGYVDTDENYAYNGMPHSAAITVPEMGLLVFRYEQPPPTAGDMNCDGVLNSLDIDPFVTALTSAPGFGDYYSDYRYCNPMLADCNYDGTVNSLDIDSFVALLTS